MADSAFIKKLKNEMGEDFFKTEVRDGWTVTEKVKKNWALCLDLYKNFKSICGKYDLKHFVIGGTLLGAVRHKGFIPWDDDFDMAMPRADYDKLTALPESVFNEPYFLQTPFTDEGYFYSYSRLCNYHATAINWHFRYNRFNLGAFIDIYPLDKCKLETRKENEAKVYEFIMKCSALMRLTNPDPPESDKQRFQKWLMGETRTGKELYCEIQRIASQYENENLDLLGACAVTPYKAEKLTWRADSFKESVELEFEGIKVTAPIGYDEVLKVNFGDYMIFPPLESRGKQHDLIIEPDIPYKEYCALNYGTKY